MSITSNHKIEAVGRWARVMTTYMEGIS